MDPPLPLPHPRPARALALALLAALVFATLAADLLLHGPVTRADVPISHWFGTHAQPWVTHAMLTVSALHATVPLLVYAAALALAFVVQRQSQWVLPLVVAVPGGLLLNAAVKLVFHRARPTFAHPLVTLSSASFPSGHAAGATVWWGFVLAVWFAREADRRRRLVACLAVAALVLLTALSRVVVGAHYPSDVLAGIAEGTLWLVLCFSAADAFARRNRQGGLA